MGLRISDFVQWLLEGRRSPVMVILTVRDDALSERVVEATTFKELAELETSTSSVEPLTTDGHSNSLEDAVLGERTRRGGERRSRQSDVCTILCRIANQGYLTPAMRASLWHLMRPSNCLKIFRSMGSPRQGSLESQNPDDVAAMSSPQYSAKKTPGRVASPMSTRRHSAIISVTR